MMSAEINSKFLKLTLNDSKVNAELSNGIVLKADLQTVKDALTSTVGAVGVENCMKLVGTAAAATAIYVAGKSLMTKWKWLKIVDVKENNVLEVVIPPANKDAFNRILESQQLERVIKDNFNDLETNLEGILGEDVDDNLRAKILNLIQHIRVSKVCRATGDLSKGTTAMNWIEGTKNVDERGNFNFVASDDSAKGVVVKDFVAPGGNLTGTSSGCSNLVMSGNREFVTETVKAAADAQAKLTENKITVTVKFADLSPKFRQKFEHTDEIYDVLSALKMEKKKDYYLVRETQPETKLPRNLKVIHIQDGLMALEEKAPKK